MTHNGHTKPSLVSNCLSIGYRADTVVENIDFELRAGQSMALVGVNGSGKSTLLKTIAGLQPPLSGNVTVFNLPPGASPGRVAYLSQFHPSGFVLPLRVIDIVRMARYPIRGLLGRITDEDETLVFNAMKTMGVEKLVDMPVWSLSTGQQQRAYLAQVLAQRADLLLLDEPEAGLDIAGRELYARVMRAELERGATIVTATHDIHRALDYDVVMLLAQRVVAIGPASEVLTRDMLIEAFGTTLPAHFEGSRIAS